MRVPIEPERSAGDYVADLPKRGYASCDRTIDGETVEADALRSGDAPDVHTQPPERVAIRPATVVGLLVVGAAFMCGWSVSALQYVSGNHYKPDTQVTTPANQPARTEPDTQSTITVTKTVSKLSESCRAAIGDTQKYLDAAAAMSAANSKQVDLMRESYQAILVSDWKKLNELTERQRALEVSIQPGSHLLLPDLRGVKENVAKCLRESH